MQITTQIAQHMRTTTRIFRLLARAPLVLAGMAFLSSSASAASLDIWVNAKGKQWALLAPGSNTGGRVVYKAALGAYITDRAARGESLFATISLCTSAEQTNPAIGNCWLSSKAGTLPLRPQSFMILFAIPSSPAWDNNCLNVQTASGIFTTRIPVGSR